MGVVKKTTMTTTFRFDEGDQRKRGTKYKGTTLLFTWISLLGMSLLSEYLVEFKPFLDEDGTPVTLEEAKDEKPKKATKEESGKEDE